MATISSPRPGSRSRVLEMFSVRDVCWVMVPDRRWPEQTASLSLMRVEKIDPETDRLLMRDIDDFACWWPADRVVKPAQLGMYASDGQIRSAMKANGLVEGAYVATSMRDCRWGWEKMWRTREERV